MRRNLPLLALLLALSLLLCGLESRAQDIARISDPDIRLVDDQIYISYEIENSTPLDLYKVGIVISDESGRPLGARALSGDIGDEVAGGSKKLIIWNLPADNIVMDGDIRFRVIAEVIPPPEPVIIPNEEIIPEQEEIIADQEEIIPDQKAYVSEKEEVSESSYPKRGKLIIQSIVIPGLGLSKITGKPHWIKGIVGYGCIAGSIYLNRKAINSFEEYRLQTSIEDARESYSSASTQDLSSEVLAYAALAIWITDIVWTVVKSSDQGSRSAYRSSQGGFSLVSDFSPEGRTPLLGFRYTF